MRVRSAGWAVALLLLWPAVASAVEVRTEPHVVVGPGEIVDDDLVAAGQSVVIDGTVTGDLIAAGDIVNVAGEVRGSAMLAGRVVNFRGVTDGSLRAAGDTVNVSGEVRRNAALAGKTVDVESAATVGRDLHAAGNSILIDGAISGRLGLAGTAATISGKIGDSVRFNGDRLTVAPDAVVAGGITYRSPETANISPSASIGGPVRHQPAPARRTVWPGAMRGLHILGFFIVLISGWVLIALAPRFPVSGADAIARNWGRTLLVGVGALILTPIVALILCVTILPLPIGLFTFAAWGLAIALAGVPAGILVGRLILQAFGMRAPASPYWGLLIGLVVICLLRLVHVVGAIVTLAAVLFGVGAYARAAKGVAAETLRRA